MATGRLCNFLHFYCKGCSVGHGRRAVAGNFRFLGAMIAYCEHCQYPVCVS